MMIWLFGVSLFQLSIAARNELKPVLHYIFLGLFVNFILMTSVMILYISFFGTIAQNEMDKISILIAIYIAKRKFFPAMNSRITDVFHYNNVRVYQGSYLFPQICLRNIHSKESHIIQLVIIFESISMNSCWFNVT